MNSHTSISITEARKNLFTIAEEVTSPDTFYTLTEHGKAKAVIMSAQEFESWVETLELLYMFPDLKKEIKKSQEEIKEGKYITHEEFKKKHL